MGITGLDIEVQSLLAFGFDHIKKNPQVIDEIFSNYKRPHLAKLYGDKEIDKIKVYIAGNDIPVKIGLSLQPEKIPGVYLVLASSNEDVGNAHLGDEGGNYFKPVTNAVIVKTFVPSSFDDSAGSVGIMTIPDDVDISSVFPGMIIFDDKEEPYLINRILSASQLEIILEGDPPSFSKATISSSIDTKRYKQGHTFFLERVDVGIIGPSSQNVTLWLYYMAVWILLRFKPLLEERCAQLHTFSATDLKKLNEKLPHHVYARWLSVRSLTDFSWIDDERPQLDGLVIEAEDGTGGGLLGDGVGGGLLGDGVGGIVDESYIDAVEDAGGELATPLKEPSD